MAATTSNQTGRKCGFPQVDVIDAEVTGFCRTHQHLAVGTKVATYEVRSDFPDGVSYVR